MAQNVKFIKGNTAKISGTAIVDGQLLWDTTTGATYVDVATVRKPTGRPVSQTLVDGDTNAVSGDAVVNNIINTNTTTVAGYMADARQLNPIISGSLASKIDGELVAITASGWNASTVDSRYPFAKVVSVTRKYSAYPNVGLLPFSGTLTTDDEDETWNMVKKVVYNPTSNQLTLFAEEAPTTAFKMKIWG